MEYLIGEIWLWLVIAYVFGLAAGWLIWGLRRKGARSRTGEPERQADAEVEIARLNARIAELEKERAAAADG